MAYLLIGSHGPEKQESKARWPWNQWFCYSAPMEQKSKNWLLAPMEQKSKKAEPCDHETNDSAIRLIGFLAPMEQKKQKSKAIWPWSQRFCYLTYLPFPLPCPAEQKSKSKNWLFCFGSGEKAKAKKPNSAFWLIGGVPIGSKIGFGGIQKQKHQKALVPNLAFWWGTKLIGGVPIGFKIGFG